MKQACGTGWVVSNQLWSVVAIKKYYDEDPLAMEKGSPRGIFSWLGIQRLSKEGAKARGK